MVSWKMMSWKLSAVVCTVVFLVLGILIGKFGIPPDLPSWLRGMSIDGDSSLTERLMKEIRADNIEKNLKYFTQKAHIAGSPREEEELVNYIFNEWKSHLDSARIYPYSVLLSYPNTSDPNYVAVQLENGTEVDVSAKVEKILNPDQEEDPTVVNPFNAYSLPGTVMGDPVYVNYGTIEDFTYMKRNLSIDLNGTIAIARYGKIFRADKVKHAAEFGCVGMVLYSDPADYAVDSEVRVYPDDWWLPGTGVQRGTVLPRDGDPLTPYYPSIEDSKVEFYYPNGWNILLTADRYVVLGNHRDAWVFGVVDPSSASAAMMELSRAFGELPKDGWRPRRSIVFCSWGAEEHGLIGSTEWVEELVKILGTRAVAYLNVDIAVEGNTTLMASGTPNLYKLLHESAKKVENPNPDEIANGRKTVFDTWLANDPSDYDPTLPSTYKLSDYPMYHSAYETFDLVSRLMDRGFKYHQAVARLLGVMTMTLAEKVILDLDCTQYANKLERMVKDIQTHYGPLFEKHGISMGKTASSYITLKYATTYSINTINVE
ncbi:UNVERIFIED_CONTAM: hypothetical protein FKN15_005786 [Acipenser sinensis]